MIPIEMDGYWINPKKIHMIWKDNNDSNKTYISFDGDCQIRVNLPIQIVIDKLTGKIT